MASTETVEHALLRLDRRESALVLFGALTPLLLLLLAPTEWNGNEETYFQLAYSKMAPEQFSEHHAIFDSSRARIVSETLLGTAVKWLGYSSDHVALRFSLALSSALGLALFFSGIGASILESFLVIAVFCAMGEELIGAESLFRGVEPKTLAYSVLFVGFGCAFRGRRRAAVTFAAAATYLHFLVGGFWTLVILLLERIDGRPLRRVALHACWFAVLVAPLIIVVVPHDLGNLMSASANGLTTDVIYSRIRASEHVAPFSANYTFWGWVPGIVVIFSLISVLTGLRHRKLLPPLGVVALLGLAYLLLALFISYFDRHTNYLGKFYLFRPSSLILFLAITAIVLAIRHHGTDGHARWIFVLLSAAFVGVQIANIAKTQVDNLRRAPAIPFERALVDAIADNSAPGDIVLLEPFNEMHAEYARLHRLIPRPTLVSWKFAPTSPAEIVRWYDLIQRRERLFAQGCVEAMQPPVTLLVIFSKEVAAKMRDCGDPVWQHGDAVLIRVKNGTTP